MESLVEYRGEYGVQGRFQFGQVEEANKTRRRLNACTTAAIFAIVQSTKQTIWLVNCWLRGLFKISGCSLLPELQGQSTDGAH